MRYIHYTSPIWISTLIMTCVTAFVSEALFCNVFLPKLLTSTDQNNPRLMTMFYVATLLHGVTWTVKGTSCWQLKQRLVTRLRYCSCIMDWTPVLESFWIEHRWWQYMMRMIGDWQTSWIMNTMGWYIRWTRGLPQSYYFTGMLGGWEKRQEEDMPKSLF